MAETSSVNEQPNLVEGNNDVRGTPEEEYILKWTDHKVNFFSLAAADLFNDEDLTDVTICCGEKLFDAHKLILSVCSPYFKNMLTHKKKLNKFALSSSATNSTSSETSSSMNCSHGYVNQMHPIIFLKDVPPCDFERLLQFMYYGEVRVPNEALESLIQTAKSLKVKGLSASAVPSSMAPPSTIPDRATPDENNDEEQVEDLSTKSRKSPGYNKHKETFNIKNTNNHTPPKKRRISASSLHAMSANNHHEHDKEHGDENMEHPTSHQPHHQLPSSHHEPQQRSTHFLSTSSERFLHHRDHHHKLRSSISAAALINEMTNERILHRRISPTPRLNTSPSVSCSSSSGSTRPMTANSYVSSHRRQPLTPPPNNCGNIGNRGHHERRERLGPIRHSSGHQLCSSALQTSSSSSKNNSDAKQHQSSGITNFITKLLR